MRNDNGRLVSVAQPLAEPLRNERGCLGTVAHPDSNQCATRDGDLWCCASWAGVRRGEREHAKYALREEILVPLTGRGTQGYSGDSCGFEKQSVAFFFVFTIAGRLSRLYPGTRHKVSRLRRDNAFPTPLMFRKSNLNVSLLFVGYCGDRMGLFRGCFRPSRPRRRGRFGGNSRAGKSKRAI